MADPNQINVLIVEDDRATAELERRALEREGISVQIAGTVAEAKIALQSRIFQAVILDYQLPDGDPWQIVEIANSQRPKIPVVLVTAQGNERVVAIAIQRGVADYVRKSEAIWTQLAATVRRVTDLAHAEAKLRRSDALMQMIANHASDVIVALDRKGCIQFVSPACLRLLDRSSDELVGSFLVDLIHREDRLKAFDTDGTAFVEPTRRETLRVNRRNDQFVWVEADFHNLADAMSDGEFEVLGILRDVTERHIAEENLRLSEEQFRGAFETAAHGMTLVSMEGCWLRVNQAFCDIVGYTKEELLALDFQSITHPDDLDADLELFAKMAKGDIATYQMEKRYFHKRGGIIWILLSVSVVRDTNSRPLHCVSQIIDITEAHQTREALRVAKEQADAANRAKSDFLATMSHEIRTPMNGILGLATLLLDTTLSDDQKYRVQLIEAAGKSLLSIINDVLDMSKIEAGRLELESAPINPNSICVEASLILNAQASMKGIDLRLECDGVMPWVSGDAARLRQVLLNLVSNAIKFTTHGEVCIATLTRLIDDEPRLFFEVRDTGVGIADHHRDRLFQEFSQINQPDRSELGGSGLGLTICKRLVEAMGGAIGFSSELGVGTTFWFSLPVSQVSAPAIAAEHPRNAAKACAKILVAEDLLLNQLVIEGILRGAGHDVVVVENGARAVEAVQARSFDMILMDMEMPVMDGLEATKAIRGLSEDIRAIPIIGLTANAFLKEKTECLAAGMNEHLSKPVDRDQLLQTVAQWSGQVECYAFQNRNEIHDLVLDRDCLADLERHLGPENVVVLIGIFRSNLSDLLATLTGAASRDEIGRAAHALISLSGNLGCAELMSRSRDLCLAVQADTSDLTHLLKQVDLAADRARRAVNELYPV